MPLKKKNVRLPKVMMLAQKAPMGNQVSGPPPHLGLLTPPTSHPLTTTGHDHIIYGLCCHASQIIRPKLNPYKEN